MQEFFYYDKISQNKFRVFFPFFERMFLKFLQPRHRGFQKYKTARGKTKTDGKTKIIFTTLKLN